MEPLVSVGIPTYKRPKLFERALKSVLIQDYQNVEILVSNNDSCDREVFDILINYHNTSKNIKYYHQNNNLGSLENLFFLLKVANGHYFMWLADDDEIEGDKYISELVSILNYNPFAVTAYARWKVMNSNNSSVYLKGKSYKSKSWIIRSLSFFWFSDDDFFYGLHRLNSLREAKMLVYFWPNEHNISNWAYVYLFDQILRGSIIQSESESIAWVNHDYTEKNYVQPFFGFKFKYTLVHVFKRINVYYLYLHKILIYKGFIFSVMFVPVAMLIILAEFCVYVGSKFGRLFDCKNYKGK